MLSRLILLSKDGTGMPSFFYKLFGLKAGKNCHIGGHIFEPHLITLGNHVHIGYDAILSGHMFNDNTKKMTVGKINIRSNVLIGARSTISPNTQIGDNVIIGAYSFVKIGSNLKANSVYAGIPVKRIKKIQKS
ncbi:MAG: hypothetical protein GON13_01145 [Nanoarchaeota archaeon]|nr:hypothetical protein [Nanoarchaeota archaeon]